MWQLKWVAFRSRNYNHVSIRLHVLKISLIIKLVWGKLIAKGVFLYFVNLEIYQQFSVLRYVTMTIGDLDVIFPYYLNVLPSSYTPFRFMITNRNYYTLINNSEPRCSVHITVNLFSMERWRSESKEPTFPSRVTNTIIFCCVIQTSGVIEAGIAQTLINF